ncbi:MAG: hypothetical protein JEY94_10745 [Melioribacteraceae bacterium]|nr:hypothetical protein [Melioribacteraceae bacterium]
MTNKISRIIFLSFVCALTLMLTSYNAQTESINSGLLEIDIEIAPGTLNIQSNGHVVTVHTDIKYFEVVHQDVYLNGIRITSWKADNRGYFVAKFSMDEVKKLAENLTVPGENELTLTGYTVDGTDFIGTETITVINNLPSKK